MAARNDDPELLRRLLDHAPAVVLLIDAETNIVWVNRTGEDLFGYKVEEVLGHSVVDYLDPAWDPEAFESIATAMGGSGQRPPMLFRLIQADGTRVIIEVTADAQMDDPVIGGMVVYARPWDERFLLDQALESLAASEPLDDSLQLLVLVAEAETLDARAAILHDRRGDRFLGAAVSDDLPTVLSGPTVTQSDEAVRAWAPIIADEKGVVHRVDDLCPTLREPARAAGFRTLWVWSAERRDDRPPEAVAIAWRFEEHLDADQTRCQAMARLARVAGLVVERVRSDEATAHAAAHDPLTGLVNRSRFYDDLEERLNTSTEAVGVIYLDLDGFKPVNDALGHGAGDEVLVEVARRIRALVHDGALAARLGGDEFAVVTSYEREVDLRELAHDLIARLSEPVELVEHDPVTIGASAGFAVSTAYLGVDPLVEAADAALYEAKHSGGGRVRGGTPSDRRAGR
jgi:diguanylate cyclase (GGDEF)-like protein/PAS domain S-box-containing protein